MQRIFQSAGYHQQTRKRFCSPQSSCCSVEQGLGLDICQSSPSWHLHIESTIDEQIRKDFKTPLEVFSDFVAVSKTSKLSQFWRCRELKMKKN